MSFGAGFNAGSKPATGAAFSFGNFGSNSSSATGSAFQFGNANSSGSSFGGGGFGGGGGFNTTSATSSLPFGSNSSSAVAPFSMGGSNPGGSFDAKTQFEKLDQPTQKKLQELEVFIAGQKNHQELVKEALNSEEHVGDTNGLMQDLSALYHDLRQEITSVNAFHEVVRNEVKQAEIAKRVADTNPADFAHGTHMHKIYLPSEYHWLKLREFEQKMEQLSNQIRELEEFWEGANASQISPKILQAIMKAQHDSVVSITAEVANSHSMADQIREMYKERLRARGEDVTQIFQPRKPKSLPLPQPAAVNPNVQQFGGQNGTTGIGGFPTQSAPSAGGFQLGSSGGGLQSSAVGGFQLGASGGGFGASGGGFGSSGGGFQLGATGFGGGNTGLPQQPTHNLGSGSNKSRRR